MVGEASEQEREGDRARMHTTHARTCARTHTTHARTQRTHTTRMRLPSMQVVVLRRRDTIDVMAVPELRRKLGEAADATDPTTAGFWVPAVVLQVGGMLCSLASGVSQ